MLSFRLRHSVILQKQTTQQDALGEPLPLWENIAVLWAEITPLKARDRVTLIGNNHAHGTT
jgi:head-tail adaptor